MLKRFLALAFIAFTVALSMGSLAQATVSVTFQVDMAAYMQTSKFNPATDSVIIRGDFQEMAGDTVLWAGSHFVMTESTTDDSVYTLAVVFPDSAVGKQINYQFLPQHAGAASWVEPGNRQYTITSASSQKIPMAWIANQFPGAVATVNLTFEVDMNPLFADGFNPAQDSVYVVGGTPPLTWNSYAAGTTPTMTPVFGNDSLYGVTMSFSNIVGAEVDYKLFGNGRDKFSNGGWESGANHVMYFPSHDTTVEWTPEMVVTKATTAADTVTFTVDMNYAYDGIHYKHITGLTSVWITGSVMPLNWPGTGWPLATEKTDTIGTDTTATLHRMFDDGTHGDSVAHDGIYAITFVFDPGVSSYVEYKYGAIFSGSDTLTVDGMANGSSEELIDNESQSGVNHVANLSLTGSHQYIAVHFGSEDPNNPGDSLGWPRGDKLLAIHEISNTKPTVFALSQNYPNPFNPTTQINYSVPQNSYVTLKIYNVLGQEVATIFAGSQKAGSYTATFDATRYASGIYFYRLQADNYSNIKKMVLLK